MCVCVCVYVCVCVCVCIMLIFQESSYFAIEILAQHNLLRQYTSKYFRIGMS